MPARLAPVGAALALVALVALLAGLVLLPVLGAASARAMGPLPACRYDDILTTPRGYGDWGITLVDTILRLPKAYVPPDLIPVTQAGMTGKHEVRAVMIDDLRAMREAALAADAAIGIQSAYRSYEEQKTVFDGWVKAFGYTRALEVSARPGHSEHQVGVAIDFKSEDGGSPFTGKWEKSAAGRWMAAHAWEYGFVMSSPEGTMDRTCYDFEPWHYRYVGRQVAAGIHASGLTPREYLWANFTTTVVPPAPAKTSVPSHTAAASAAPSPSSTAAPTVPPTPSPSPAPTPNSLPTPGAEPSPVATPASGDGQAAAGIPPVALGGAALLAGALLTGAWLAARRGRSGVGL
jgi:D-alanyl-D-alanine carboxypeptidase